MSQQERCPTANDAAVILYEIAAKADELEGMPVDYGLAMELAKVVKRIKESVDRPQGSVVAEQPQPTRFAEFDDADHPFRKWWEKHGQYMMSGGGRRESIWAARGWIAREQLMCGVEVTGESLAEQPSREQSTSSGSGILEPHKTSLAVTEGQGEPNGAALPDSPREQAVEGLVRAARLALGQLLYLQRSSENLPSTQNTITEVEAALAHYEASRGERQ